MSAKDFPEEHRAIYNSAYVKGLEQGSGIEQKLYWTKGVDHGIESNSYSSKSDLLIAKSHPLLWCSECKKG